MGIKRFYRRAIFDKKDDFRLKNGVEAIPIRLLTPDFRSWDGLGVG